MTEFTRDAIDPAVEMERLRPRLFGIAYRMLGSVADAEDVVQEVFLRWEQTRAHGTDVKSAEAWQVSVVTRLCIDHLRSARVQRERYIGEWLPEPLVADAGPSAEESAELAESVSMAFLLLLERLSPVERAVYLLHEVFDYPFAEIAQAVGKSEAACRQLAKRARDRIGTSHRRFDVEAGAGERMATEFLRASVEGDFPALLALLTEDVALVADGGGKVGAARKPVQGADLVARFLIGIAPLGPHGWTARPATVNGGPGLAVWYPDGRPYAVISLEPAGTRVDAIRIILNPDKLHGVPGGVGVDSAPGENGR